MKHKIPLILGFDGKTLSRETAKHLSSVDPVGLILFKRNLGTAAEIHRLVRQIKDLLGDVILSIDHEGGLVNRFGAEFAVPPAVRALHSIDGNLQRQGAQMLAALPAHFGFNLNFAPVADLHQSGGFLGARAFASSPQEVSAFAQVQIEAHETFGVGSCVKHFPGHGRVSVDTHQRQAVLNSSLAEMMELDLVPYLQTKAPVVMASHVVYPALDSQYPASLSKKILKGLLKEKLGYQGLVVTDCLEMSALDKFGPEKMVDLGVEAEIDLWVSSFSLKRSLSFQRKLADRLQENTQVGPNPKISSFLSKYRPKPTPLIPVSQSIELRARSIQKSGPVPSGPWVLVHLGGAGQLKVNQGEATSSFCQGMAAACPEVRKTFSLSWERLQTLGPRLGDWGTTGFCILLAYDHAKAPENGVDRLEKLAKGYKILHLDLGETIDLMGANSPKWRCFGTDPLTIQAISRELNQRNDRNQLLF